MALARELQTRAGELQTGAERRQLAELDGMLQRPANKVTVTQLTDQAFRPDSARRGIDQFLHILDTRGRAGCRECAPPAPAAGARATWRT